MLGKLRNGLTITELLIVVGIIALLIALLIPAVQYARESARVSTCKNNLRQISLATLQYANTHSQRLPPSWLNVLDENGKPAKKAKYHFHIRSLSWRVAILPYLEQSALYDRFDLSAMPFSNVNSSLSARVLVVFQCPSTPESPRQVSIEILKPHPPVGANDYSHVYFVGTEKIDDRGISADQAAGAWYSQSLSSFSKIDGNVAGQEILEARGSARLRFVTDGLSGTLLCAEKAGFPDIYQNDQVVSSTWGDGVWAAGEFGGFGKVSVNWANFPSIYSFHSSGAHVAMCDGSVRMLSTDTNLDVIVALCSCDAHDNQ
jgi:prepilin-type processing-associated H-X9-DG protein